jgi:hypothetical protein
VRLEVADGRPRVVAVGVLDAASTLVVHGPQETLFIGATPAVVPWIARQTLPADEVQDVEHALTALGVACGAFFVARAGLAFAERLAVLDADGLERVGALDAFDADLAEP